MSKLNRTFMRCISLFLVWCALAAFLPLGANATSTGNEEPLSVTPEVVDSIVHPAVSVVPYSYTSSVQQEIILIEDELSQLYLQLQSPAILSQSTSTLDRITQLEQQLESFGFRVLDSKEASAVLGLSSGISPQSTPPSNWNTSSAKFIVSPLYSVTLSDGSKIPYYYVTAYNTTTSSNLVSMKTMAMKQAQPISGWAGAILRKYMAKAASFVVGKYAKYLEAFPYELIQYKTVPDTSAAYTVEAVYTSTARFFYSYNANKDKYLHEGTSHRTSVANHHVMRYSYMGKSQIDSSDESYSLYTDYYYNGDQLVKERWENQIGSLYVETIADVKYYYKKSASASEELLYTVSVPHVQYPSEIN